MFFGYDRFSSASSMYVNERINYFWAMYRKAVFSLTLAPTGVRATLVPTGRGG